MIFFRPAPEYDQWEDITWQRRLRIWTSGWRGPVVLLLIVLAVLAWWKGGRAYTLLKEKRAESLVAQSQAALLKGDQKEALIKLSQAIALLQRHPLTLRALAHYKLAVHDLSGLDAYEALIKTGRATLEDKLDFARQAFRLGRPDLAAPVISELKDVPEAKDTSTVLVLQALQAATARQWPEALKLGRQAAQSPGSDEDLAFVKAALARLLLQAPPPEGSAPAPEAGRPGHAPVKIPAILGKETIVRNDQDFLRGLNLQLAGAGAESVQSRRAEGVALLSSLAQRQDAIGLESLGYLAGLPENMPCESLFQVQDVRALQDAAEKHADASAALKVSLWNLRLVAEPEAHMHVAQEFYEHFKTEKSPALRLEAARWLNQKGFHLQVLEIAEPFKWESEDWFLVYLDALAASGKWQEVLETLTNPAHKVPLSEGVRQMFVLRCEVELGKHPNLADSWRNIEIACQSDSPNHQLYVAGYAEQTGIPSEAVIIYRRLLQGANGLVSGTKLLLGTPERLACYYGILRDSAPTMKIEDLCALADQFAAEFPQNDDAQNEDAYVRLLEGKNIDKAEKIAQELSLKRPNDPAVCATAALAALRRQDNAAAAKLYAERVSDWSKAPESAKVVYVAVMRRLGRADEAEKVLAQTKTENLRPEERQLAGLP